MWHLQETGSEIEEKKSVSDVVHLRYSYMHKNHQMTNSETANINALHQETNLFSCKSYSRRELALVDAKDGWKNDSRMNKARSKNSELMEKSSLSLQNSDS